jgi:hypothetical protein
MQVSYMICRTQDVRHCAQTVAFSLGIPLGFLASLVSPVAALLLLSPIIAHLTQRLNHSWQYCMSELSELNENDQTRVQCAIRKYGGQHWYLPILWRGTFGVGVGAGLAHAAIHLLN